MSTFAIRCGEIQSIRLTVPYTRRLGMSETGSDLMHVQIRVIAAFVRFSSWDAIERALLFDKAEVGWIVAHALTLLNIQHI